MWTLAAAAVACGGDDSEGAGTEAGAETSTESTTSQSPHGSSTSAHESGASSASDPAASGSSGEAADASSGTGSSGQVLDEPVDELIENMEPNSWLELPMTFMADVCPEPYEYYGCRSVMIAWSGAAYDHGRDRMIVWGGGHADSYYNNVFVFNLGSMQWQRLTELPEGADGSNHAPAMQDLRLETCGYYPSVDELDIDEADLIGNYLDPEVCHRPDIEAQLDLQQPRSSHSYGKPVYLPNEDVLFYQGGGYYPSAQATSPWGFLYSFGTGLWSESARRPVAGRGTAAVDAEGNAWYATDAGGPLARFRPADNEWDSFGSLNYDLRGQGDIDRARNDFWFLLDAGLDVTLRRVDLDDETLINSSDPYIDVPLLGNAPPQGVRAGFVYADTLDRMVAWVGGRYVYFLNPEDEVWTHAEGTGDEPTPPASNGTYGRWRFSTARGVFVLVNHTEENVFIYKPPAEL